MSFIQMRLLQVQCSTVQINAEIRNVIYVTQQTSAIPRVIRKLIQKMKSQSHKRLGDSQIHEHLHEMLRETAVLWLHALRNLLRCMSSTLHREKGGCTRRRHFPAILLMQISHCGASGYIMCNMLSYRRTWPCLRLPLGHTLNGRGGSWRRRSQVARADLGLLRNSRQCRPPCALPLQTCHPEGMTGIAWLLGS